MKCSACGAEGLCWFNAQRRLVCRSCKEDEQRAQYQASINALVGKHMLWRKADSVFKVPVTVLGMSGGWVLVQDDAGVTHRVRFHNVDYY